MWPAKDQAGWPVTESKYTHSVGTLLAILLRAACCIRILSWGTPCPHPPMPQNCPSDCQPQQADRVGEAAQCSFSKVHTWGLLGKAPSLEMVPLP